MPFDPTTSDHWRSCLLPPGARAVDGRGAAAFFIRTYARDLLATGTVRVGAARTIVRAFATLVGGDDAMADEATDAVELDLERSSQPGDEVAVDAACARLREVGVAVRVGLDCCREVGIARVEREHADGDRWFAVVGIADLLRVARAERIDVAFSYLDAALQGELTPELHARAAAGDTDAQAAWMATVDREERAVGTAISAAMRSEGLEVEWDGTANDTMHVAVPRWRRPIPA